MKTQICKVKFRFGQALDRMWQKQDVNTAVSHLGIISTLVSRLIEIGIIVPILVLSHLMPRAVI
jgi:hypothetical protein